MAYEIVEGGICCFSTQDTCSPGWWDGEASVGFATRLEAAASTWDEAAIHLLLLANLTENYAGVLEWAQGEAARAIELWEKGELDSARGLAEYRSLLTRARPTEILPYYRDRGGAGSQRGNGCA
ncbi:putative T7SS-secreted protein [Microbacterium testaceum]|uniref:putative T7SS-secreted protein n=1 Tax=Microbacterium testaceum TaxID=2033 RepID=UPI003D73DCD2